MFQQTIQDVLALAEAAGRTDALLSSARSRLSDFELFQGAELVARTDAGPRRFVVSPGLGDAAVRALEKLDDEPTLRVDTAHDMKAFGLSEDPSLSSLLALRLSAPGVSDAAIVLGHSRAWSFAGTPLSRVRTIGQVALRLLLPVAESHASEEELGRLRAEVSRLRVQVATLENEVASHARPPIAAPGATTVSAPPPAAAAPTATGGHKRPSSKKGSGKPR